MVNYLFWSNKYQHAPCFVSLKPCSVVEARAGIHWMCAQSEKLFACLNAPWWLFAYGLYDPCCRSHGIQIGSRSERTIQVCIQFCDSLNTLFHFYLLHYGDSFCLLFGPLSSLLPLGCCLGVHRQWDNYCVFPFLIITPLGHPNPPTTLLHCSICASHDAAQF